MADRYQEGGYDGLYDRRDDAAVVSADFNVRHFHGKLTEEHGNRISYTRVKMALQGPAW